MNERRRNMMNNSEQGVTSSNGFPWFPKLYSWSIAQHENEHREFKWCYSHGPIRQKKKTQKDEKISEKTNAREKKQEGQKEQPQNEE